MCKFLFILFVCSTCWWISTNWDDGYLKKICILYTRVQSKEENIPHFLSNCWFAGAYIAFYHVPGEYIIEIQVQMVTSFRLKSLTLRELGLFDVCNIRASFTMLYFTDAIRYTTAHIQHSHLLIRGHSRFMKSLFRLPLSFFSFFLFFHNIYFLRSAQACVCVANHGLSL